MIKWIVNLLLGPIVSIGEKYLDNQKDKTKLEHGTKRVAVEADSAVRKIKLGSMFLSAPLFIAEASVALYFASILIDSMWPSHYFNPLALPNWFLPYFDTAIVSIFGLSAADKIATKWNRK